MLRKVILTVILIGLILPAAYGQMKEQQSSSSDKLLIGTWKRFQAPVITYLIIGTSDGLLTVKIERLDGLEVKVEDISWNGKILRFKATTVTSGFWNIQELSFENSQTLRARVELQNGKILGGRYDKLP